MFAHYALSHRRSLRSGLILAAGLVALLAAAPAFAAGWQWTGAGANNSWNNFGNWFPLFPSGPPENNGTADIYFGATPRLNPDLTLAWNVNSLTFDNTAGAYNLISTLGHSLTVGAGGITNNDNNTQTINHAITLFAPQTWNAAAAALQFSGAVNNGGNLLTINGATNNAVYIFGAISGGGGLTKNGVGELQFLDGANNTYSGTTTVNAGNVTLNKLLGLAIPGSLDIGDGVGTDIDTVRNLSNEQITDSASVSVFSTGAWVLDNFSSETITNLNIVSTGIAGGALVTVDGGVLTILGSTTMTGGTVTATATGTEGTLRLNGDLATNGSAIAASISSQLDLGNGARTFTIDDGAAPNDLDVTGVVSNGGIIKDGPGALRLGAANTYAGGTTLNAGTILIGHDAALGTGQLTGNGGTLRADGAARTIANEVTGSFAVDGVFDLALSSSLNGDITKNGPGTLDFAQAGAIINSLTVNAGTARVDAAVTFTDGLTNSATVLVGAQTLTVNGAGLDNQGSLPLAGGTLAGSGPIVNSGLISGNGTISAPFANSGGTLRVVGETMNVTNAFTNSGVIRLDGGARLVGGAITNTGLIQGDGTIANALTNAAGGELRADPGKSLTFTDSGGYTNAGQIRLLGGALDFQAVLTNDAGAFISGNGSLITGGLTNNGTMNFAGTANIVGNVTNSVGGKIISGGGGATIFYDDVTNDGEIRTSTNGFTVFFGSVSGSGSFTGTGTVNFEGDLSPGNSPAAVSFAGDVVIGPEAVLAIELGGATLGAYDRILVTGGLVLDGTLEVSILPGFTPSAGLSFDILNWGSLDGEFFEVNLPTLAGLTWNQSQLYISGELSLADAGLSGDYNNDSVVNAADYVSWRDHLGAAASLPNDSTPGVAIGDYDVWKENFGAPAGGGSAANAQVPEPVTLVLLIVGMLAFIVRRSAVS